MMGDRDHRSVIRGAIDSIGRELEIDIDAGNADAIHLREVVQCLRRSYYDRVDPLDVGARGFNELLAGLLRKLQYGSQPATYDLGDISLTGQADMIVDDTVLLFRSAVGELDSPDAEDLLYLNACMWIYEKQDGLIVYITGDRKETTFSLTRTGGMFEEIVRRVRVMNNLLKDKKVPMLEPSGRCADCQYYDRCYTKKKNTKQISLAEMLGLRD